MSAFAFTGEEIPTLLTTMRTVALPSGEAIPVLGQGTWHMAEDPALREQEIAALRLGLDLGMKLIDTAEMYADGATEVLVGEAIAGRRGEVFLVSKVLPQHATYHGTIAACEASLSRLGTDHLDLYLLHWRGHVPLAQTLAGFAELRRLGLIRYWGVSNFDAPDMADLLRLPGGADVQTDQVLYNLARRGIEWDLLPWCKEYPFPIMAYSPVEQGELLGHPALRGVAERHEATPAQVALAWVLRHDNISAIPKMGTPGHVYQNRAAVRIRLTDDDLRVLDQAFPPPFRKMPLETH
ncbi:aldo/keto reductase [Sphaerisporangium perillae]|uniref:aldo/keto reductase n=1 Tax=Sphaerisporangium perillae TaxID=2935860 RepID=UPI0027E1B35D|nr:aldo/keto reductase [Sphaerisporangium perillae]